jgi:Transcription factor WhiB
MSRVGQGQPEPERALCRHEGHPSDWDDTLDDEFEPEAYRRQRHARAKAVCARCPVRLWCEGEVDLWRDSGIWFGLHLEAWREAQHQSRQGQFVSDSDRWSA